MKKIIWLSSMLCFQHSQAQDIKFYDNQQVIVYENGKYTGQSRTFRAGLWPLKDFNDMASSIQIPSGMVAVIYEHANENGGYGAYIDLLENCENLSLYNFNDKASFISVFQSTLAGKVYVRNRMVNKQFYQGHWERSNPANPPDNSLPAIPSELPEIPEVPKPKGENLPAFEDIPVFRLQLRITTGTGTDAGTDNPVYTQLNTKDDRFYLVRSFDNFRESSVTTYDVIFQNIRTIKDIEFIRLGIKGEDGLCIKKIDLILNNHRAPVFSKVWNDSKGYCIDNNSSTHFPMIEIGSAELRKAPGWKLTTTYPSNIALCWKPTSISKEWITSLVEASIGNKMQNLDGDVKWGVGGTFPTLWGDAVESKILNEHAFAFDLDLRRDLVGPDTEVDIDFELDFHCINGVLSAEVQNLKVSMSDFAKLRESITEAVAVFSTAPSFFLLFETINTMFNAPLPDGTTVPTACTSIFIDSNRNLRLR